MANRRELAVRKNLGERIRELRVSQGLSQADLAADIDVSRETIVFIENGKQNPTTDMLLSIADGLGVKIRDLFSFDY